VKSLLIRLCAGCLLAAGVVCQGQISPLLIAWQAPPPAPFSSTTWSAGYLSALGTGGICSGITQYVCFTSNVLPNISGIGIVVPWGEIDKCSTSTSCLADDSCNSMSGTCFNWQWLDTPLMTYVNASIGSGTWSNGCAGGRPCKIVLIVTLTADAGNSNLYVGSPNQISNQIPNTPPYIFTQNWANVAGWANQFGGCTPPNNCAPQDVLVCQGHQGSQSTGTGWGGVGAPMQDTFTGSCAGDCGLWNVNGVNMLQGTCWNPLVPPVTSNFSGYPVMYENPIFSAATNFIRALSLHYSNACTNVTYPNGACGNGPTIAKSIAYMRIGPSSGGENFPYCACTSSVAGSQCNTFYWPGPKGYAAEPGQYSDQGYLTSWPNDGTGYVASLYQYIHSLNWNFPIDTPMEHGPPQNKNYIYPDTEALLASQSNFGIGMQALNIGDSVTYAANTYNFFPGFLLPSTVENWAVNFREFPNVPDHHLQTAQPGSPSAARFTIGTTGNITILSSSCTSSSCPNATINCAPTVDCNPFCNVAPWVYVSGNSNPALNGIQQVNINGSACLPTSPNTIALTGSFPPTPGVYPGGYVYSAVHLPVLLPFVTQQCQGSPQTICSVEIWEALLDWAYGTITISGTQGDTSYGTSGDSTYKTAISNFFTGLPSSTSFHNNMFTNANQY